jgi:cell wall-associated NlpC family hydrolase
VRVRGVVDGSAIVETARHYLGVRYVLGGTTPRAFDCSGFVRYVFAQHGLAFPRTAHEQAALGRAPAPGELEPGDLLFFYGGRGAQHIAIYIGGDSIIHASSSGHRVKLDRLPGRGARRSWFGQRLIAVRRVLPADGTIDLPQSLAVPEPEVALPADPRSLGPALPLIF